MYESTHRFSRLSAALIAGALIASVASISAVSGQNGAGPEDLVPTSAPVQPSASVAVVGDGLLAGSNVAPLRDAECRSSYAGPIEQAARAVPETVVSVANLACDGASLRDLTREQIPNIPSDADRVFVGGTALEFDWIALEASCLNTATRSPSECIAASEFARATAANSFFSWRSALQQIARTAPDAEIAVVSGPSPVSEASLLLGSECCSEQVDANARVRAVFETADASRAAVIESLPDLPVVVVDAMSEFEGHASSDATPWIVGADAGPGFVTGIPNASGVATLASLVGPMMPAGPTPIEPPAALANEVAIVLAATSATEPTADAIASAASAWFEAADGSQSVWVTTVAAPPTPEPEPIPEPAPEPEPAEDPADEAPAPDRDDPEPPAPEAPAEDDEPTPDPPPAEGPTPEEPDVGDPALEEPEAPADPEPAEDDPDAEPEELPAPVPDPVDPPVGLQADAPDEDEAPPADPAPEDAPTPEPTPVVANSAAALVAALGDVTPLPDGTNPLGADVTAAIAAVTNLPWTETAHRSVLLVIDTVDASEDDANAIAAALTNLPVDTVTIVAPSVDSAVALAALATDTPAAVVALNDPDATLDLLPTVPVAEDLIEVSAPDAFGVLGQDIPVYAVIDTAFASDAVVTWSTEDGTIAVGQRSIIDAGRIGAGTHDVTLTATSARASVTTNVVLTISVDGDGLDGEACTAFDPTNVDTDADLVADACDTDDDGDGIPDTADPCDTIANSRLRDIDRDGIPDVCDGDAHDGPGADFDGDGTPDITDNCPAVANANQNDADSDGTGDSCETPIDVQCTITGTAGDDVLVGTPGVDVICGLGGNDELIGNGGDDHLIGGPGDDILRGHDGDDRLVGGAGNDILLGREGNDVLIGGLGLDRLEGDEGSDILDGSADADRLNGDDGDDLLFGGPGADDLNGGNGDDMLVGGRGNDTLLGKNGADTAHGEGGADRVRTGAGNDTIIDSRNVDSVSPGAGTDLIGGASGSSVS